ncbi:MAG: hypothetical protein NTV56_01605, partial [Alphaproteobacteria bacterium]|nr:hypothetical protein [Alphaproteobacteria bacterium]
MSPGLDNLTGDHREQAEFVVNSAWRLQSLQDDNALSPTHGCFHYSYWRDKTSEFPDARFQEAGAALGLLSLPFFDSARQAGRLPPSDELYRAFSAGLGNLARQQYPEGCFDEWYKGERGFAATEFTLIAYGLAARTMGDALAPADRTLLRSVAEKAGRWLAKRDDRVKSNHEAAAAAALALIWELTGDDSFKTAARRKLDDTLARQNAEGWFPEIGGMDLGYCSVLLDYVMVHALVTKDSAAMPSMERLFQFMLPLIHPDGTISPEMGLCLNPYVSRLGIGLLSEHSEAPRALVSAIQLAAVGTEGLRPYLADDLRLARWSYLPLMTGLLASGFRASEAPLTSTFKQGWTSYRSAAVCAFHDANRHVYFSPAGGGGVRVYTGQRLVYEDLGFRMQAGEQHFGTTGYDPDRQVSQIANGFSVSAGFGAAEFFFPSFLSRLLLRLGCTTALGARLLRAMIDSVRLKRRTAANQSAAPVSGATTGYNLERKVEILGLRICITDRIAGPDG